MKLLWLCNMIPSAIQETLTGKAGGGLWVDQVLCGLRQQPDITVRILCPSAQAGEGDIADDCSYRLFREGLAYEYMPELETQFRQELEIYMPDVIHIWGTEYGHTLAMVNAAETTGLLDRVVVHIQGLCSVYADHYAEGVPAQIQREYTFRDFVRRDNIHHQQRKFVLRGELEIQALRKVHHVIGRTDWDEACTKRVNPAVEYHFCNETLREAFYTDKWQHELCQQHNIFASSCVYPIKGFHYLLSAFAEIVKRYPNATLSVPGNSFVAEEDMKAKIRKNRYHKYLMDLAMTYGIADRITFLGSLNGEGMKQAYLNANVFVLPSTIENSPNSLGEAMLLGVPCVASDVGGVTTMMTHEKEGYVYQSTAPYMLAHYIMKVFEQQKRAETMGAAAREHALRTHNPEKNLQDLLGIYQEIMK